MTILNNASSGTASPIARLTRCVALAGVTAHVLLSNSRGRAPPSPAAPPASRSGCTARASPRSCAPNAHELLRIPISRRRGVRTCPHYMFPCPAAGRRSPRASRTLIAPATTPRRTCGQGGGRRHDTRHPTLRSAPRLNSPPERARSAHSKPNAVRRQQRVRGAEPPRIQRRVGRRARRAARAVVRLRLQVHVDSVRARRKRRREQHPR